MSFLKRLTLVLVAIASADLLDARKADAHTTAIGVDLPNGDFESKLEPWTTHIYGAPATTVFDSEVKYRGNRSLRVSASGPSDAALGQEVQLRPRQWYRFRGFVRTEKLEPQDAAVYGTFQIQYPGGNGVIASGKNHRGNNDWTEVVIVFQSPRDGKTRIAPFLAGYGKGTGAAWFDALTLEEIDAGKAAIRILPDSLNGGIISPFQYGQFIEYLCDSVPAIWAEKLYDGSFEGLRPYKVRYLNTDFREKRWYPSYATNRARFSLSKENPVSGKSFRKFAATATHLVS